MKIDTQKLGASTRCSRRLQVFRLHRRQVRQPSSSLLLLLLIRQILLLRLLLLSSTSTTAAPAEFTDVISIVICE